VRSENVHQGGPGDWSGNRWPRCCNFSPNWLKLHGRNSWRSSAMLGSLRRLPPRIPRQPDTHHRRARGKYAKPCLQLGPWRSLPRPKDGPGALTRGIPRQITPDVPPGLKKLHPAVPCRGLGALSCFQRVEDPRIRQFDGQCGAGRPGEGRAAGRGTGGRARSHQWPALRCGRPALRCARAVHSTPGSLAAPDDHQAEQRARRGKEAPGGGAGGRVASGAPPWAARLWRRLEGCG
jgi:hypothetical protein